MQTFTLEIDADQLAVLIIALEAQDLTPDGIAAELLELLKGVPAVERVSPKVIHGLCH